MLPFKILFRHQWLEFRRSSFWQRSLTINIIISVLLLYLALNFVALGWFLDVVLKESFPDEDIILKLSELLFFYFSIDLIIRFLMQDMPVISITPYLHLPVSRKKIFNYLLFKSILNFFNLIPLLIFVPFFIKIVYPQLGNMAFIWLTGVLSIVVMNNYLSLFLKKVFNIRPVISIICLALIGLIGYMDFAGYSSISEAFGRGHSLTQDNPVFILIPVLAAVLSYFLVRRLLGRFVYLESQGRVVGQSYSLSDSFSFLKRLGIAGDMIMLEIRLIFRNTRPRTLAIMSGLMIFYGLIIYPSGMEIGYGFLIIPAFFVIGLFMFSHGQLIIAWDSSHYDFFLVNDLSSFDILSSKFRLFLGVNTIFFLASLPYGLYGNVIYFVNACIYLYNSGVTVFILLLVGVYNNRRVDLTKGAFFNYQGFSAMTYLLVLPALILPFILYFPFSFFGYPLAGIGFLGVLGITGIIFNGSIIKKMASIMTRRKYITASGFRGN